MHRGDDQQVIDRDRRLADLGRALRCLVSLGTARPGEGQLSGLTYFAKDLFDTPGRAPSLGLGENDAAPPDRSASLLRALDAAGAVRLGFAEMTALACEPSGSNPLRQRPLNPWDPNKICGGSSSGSAVAVAAGLSDFAIGSDTAGSLRIPAQCCGVTAWKPTPALLPTDGAMALSPSLDVLGFMARDAATLQRIAFALLAERPAGPSRRVGVAHDLAAQSVPQVAAGVTGLASALVKLGCSLLDTPLTSLLAECDPYVMDLLQSEISAQHGWRLIEPDKLDAGLEVRLRKGLSIGPERAQIAARRLHEIAAALPVFTDCDVVLLPAMTMTTPEVSACEPGSPGFSARTLYGLSACTRFVNGLGLPAIAIPCGFDDAGMPIAAQLVGRPDSDVALLELAAEVQRSTDWHGREPAALDRILEAAR